MSSGYPRHTHSSRSQILISCKIPVPAESAPTLSLYTFAVPARLPRAGKRLSDYNYPQTVYIVSAIHQSAILFSSMLRRSGVDALSESSATPLSACPNFLFF